MLKGIDERLEWYEDSGRKHLCCICKHLPNGWCVESTMHSHPCNGKFSSEVFDHMDGITPFDPEEDVEDFSQKSCQFWVLRCNHFERYIDHAEYLQSDRWKKTRRKRIELDGYKCALCGYAKNLNVHHITYDRIGFEDMEDLVTLCKQCHEQLHSTQEVINKMDQPMVEFFNSICDAARKGTSR